MDPLSIEQITHFAGAVRQDIPAERIVTHLSTDSRTVQPGDLFVALRGENFDGHKFVNDAFLRGAVGAIVEQKWEGKAPSAFASSGLRIRSLPTSKSRPTTDVR
jgi:UDP-N-acetylmuramyl pentapeptide synthase